MLLTALFPLCDLRPLLGAGASRSSRLDWPAAGPGEAEFIPWFGALRATGRNALLRGERACHAPNALKIRSWPLTGIAGFAGPGPFRAVFRDLVSDGEVLARFDLTLGTHETPLAKLPALTELAERFTTLLVEIPEQRRGRQLELLYAGSPLAAAYLDATTLVSERPYVGSDWIAAGDPVFFVQWSMTEGLSPAGLPKLVPIEGEPVSVARAALPAAGPHASVWYLAHSGAPGAAERANALRVAIADLSARRECLRAVLQRIVDGRLAPPPNRREERKNGDDGASAGPAGAGPASAGPASADHGTEARPPPSPSDVLQTYLNDAVREIDRRQRKVPVSTAQLPAWSDLGDTRDAPRSPVGGLEYALKRLDVRGNIRRNVTAWALRDWTEGGTADVPTAERGLENKDDCFEVTPPPFTDPTRSPVLTFGDAAGEGPEDAPALDSVLHARLGAVGRELVDPGDNVTFGLELQLDLPLPDAGPAAASGAFALHFDEGVLERRLFVRVDSRDFARPVLDPHHPEANPWEKTFVIKRGAESIPSWSFVAQARGDRPTYELAVHLVLDGSPVGTLQVKLGRRGASVLAQGSTTAKIGVPGNLTGADFVVAIDHEGETLVVKWSSKSGEPLRWPIHFDTMLHFNALGNKSYQPLRALQQYCRKLASDLDHDLFAALQGEASAGRTVLVTSQTPMLPFELIPLGRNQPFLGTACPIARWVSRRDMPLQAARAFTVGQVACIRPDYPPPRALPSAQGEEDDLRTWAPNLVRVADRAGFDALIERADVDLVHFAGHAEDNPPGLALSGRERIDPAELWDTPLAKRRPLFFVNGCRASMSHAGLPPSLGGMIESLLSYDLAGVVAPFISVDSTAARRAARVFYEALRAGSTVADSVRAIRACSETDPEQAATYLSYLAYTPPGLRLA